MASVIGRKVASFPVTYGPLYYRDLEKTKSNAFRLANDDFDEKMSLPSSTKTELQWRVNNVETAFKKIVQDAPLHQITTDASRLGWGGGGGRSHTSHKLPRNACCVPWLVNVHQR